MQLATDTDARISSEAERTRARLKPALAVWRLERKSKRALPSELARQLVAHYTEPGDLVLAALGTTDALGQARRLHRRGVTHNTRRAHSHAARSAELVALRPDERAELALAAVNARGRGAAGLAAQLRDRLKPGGFLVLALNDARGPLGAIVGDCQQQGLQYWQHVVAIGPGEPEQEDADSDTATNRGRSLRSHRDLLVFRRPTQADALASEAAAVTRIAA